MLLPQFESIICTSAKDIWDNNKMRISHITQHVLSICKLSLVAKITQF
jgi:hypothetical protein